MNFKKVEGDDFTGRIIWFVDGNGVLGEGSGLDDCVTFYCGAETAEGYLDDGGQPDETFEDIETVLSTLFSDHMMDIELSENFHSVYLNEGETHESLLSLMKERLSSTNAVEKDINDMGFNCDCGECDE